ncbi:hypothetical protein JOC48_002127 [Aquibacillus albus]|uniref:YtzI protein n=1 Tax=Aquibacillus albus TaxID=1168171 RepID=A0ABS2N0Q0_9BACI|nr:hypothetical protein [Aquibacillus albus]
MGVVLVLGVGVAFITAIFAAGYETDQVSKK